MSSADALTVSRLALAVVLPLALLRGGVLPAALWMAAAASDYLDGPLARRLGRATGRGALLDNAADVAFVLGGLATAAAVGLVPWLVPAAIALAVVDYARAAFEERQGLRQAPPARSAIGHAAGVLNYACLGVVCARVAWAAAVPPGLVTAAELVTVAANVGAVADRRIRSR